MVVKIKGHDVKFSFGLYFLGKAQKERNTDLNGVLQSLIKNPIVDMVDLMFYSAKCEAEIDEINLPITKRDFLEYLESCNDFQKTDGILAKWSAGLVDSVSGNFLPENTDIKESDSEVKKK